MKLFWKIFFSTITVTMITFSVGSYLLISAMFDSSLEREIQSAYSENDMLRTSVSIAVSNVPYNGILSDETLRSIAQPIRINTLNGILQISISDEDYNILYTNSSINAGDALLKALPGGSRGYKISELSGKRYIDAASAMDIGEQTIYLENFRDISAIFDTRAEQFSTLQKLLIGLVIIIGILVFGISMWLTYPIKKLSQATKLMAAGNFPERIAVKSNDEIGMLSEDYNVMADTIRHNIDELKAAKERQEDFVGSFAHELKTPLTSMIGYADMLRSKKMTPEQNFMAANYIFGEGKRLEALSLKLMEMIVLKKEHFDMKKVRARELLDAVVGVVRPVLESENIELVTSVEEASISVEPDLIKTVCINLIDNAKKAIDNGGLIELTGTRSGADYTITVRDDGRGIPENELSKITEAFYMVDKSRSRASGGAGLGLAICADIIKLHGGEMKFESEPGKGTTVSVYLKEACV